MRLRIVCCVMTTHYEYQASLAIDSGYNQRLTISKKVIQGIQIVAFWSLISISCNLLIKLQLG